MMTTSAIVTPVTIKNPKNGLLLIIMSNLMLLVYWSYAVAGVFSDTTTQYFQTVSQAWMISAKLGFCRNLNGMVSKTSSQPASSLWSSSPAVDSARHQSGGGCVLLADRDSLIFEHRSGIPDSLHIGGQPHICPGELHQPLQVAYIQHDGSRLGLITLGPKPAESGYYRRCEAGEGNPTQILG